MKKIFLFTMTMMMLFTLPAFAAQYPMEGDFLYELREDGTARIMDYIGEDTTIVIPSEIGGATVTEIRRLGGRSKLKADTVIIPSTVLYISSPIDESDTLMDESAYPDNPFVSMEYLSAIIVDEANTALVSIDNVLFLRTETGLSLVSYPRARADETGAPAQSYVIPEGTVSIGRDALRCATFAEVTFPTTLTAISIQAFSECENLLRVELPESVTEISSCVFNECMALTEAVLPDSITTLPRACFAYCRSLQSVKMPAQLTELGPRVFKACESLTSLNLPAGLTVIAEDAFAECPFQP